MMKNDDNMAEIRKIEDKYGLIMFRMALSHLVDVGHRNFGDGEVEETIAEIMTQGEKDKTDGKITVMTPEFKCDIIRCAAELSKFSIWTLFVYIKKYVIIK